MKIFVFEHLAGGIHGDVAALLEPSLLRQGEAMLQAAAADFVDLGAQVVTMLHERASCPGAEIVTVEQDTQIEAMFDQLVEQSDGVLVIAPETGGALVGWLQRVEAAGGLSFGSTPDAAALCGDKLDFAHHLNVVNILTPPTRALSDGVEGLDYPIVVKPRFGAGCEDTFLLRGADDLAVIPDDDDAWIVQPFVNGIDVSCGVMVHGADMRALPPGEQFIFGNSLMQYRGGRIGLDDDLAKRATELAINAVGWVAGLRGFVGVDMVLGSDAETDRVIEINPRLTLSYIALRQLCETNLAAAMLDPDAPLSWRSDTVRFDGNGQIQPEPTA